MERGLGKMQEEEGEAALQLGFGDGTDEAAAAAPDEEGEVAVELEELEKIGEVGLVIERGEGEADGGVASGLGEGFAGSLDDGGLVEGLEHESGGCGVWHVVCVARRYRCAKREVHLFVGLRGGWVRW